MHTLFLLYKNVVFPAQAKCSYFSADFRLKMFLYYSYIIAYDISVLELIGVSITSVWYLDLFRVTLCARAPSLFFAIASAGFFVLLASSAVQGKELFYTVKLET